MSNNVIIDVRNAKKIYRMGQEKIRAVNGVSFTVDEGEFCCLVGTSGSGKSTLLNLMAGIEKLTSGEVLIKGQSIGAMSENKLAKFRQENLGFVFQSYNLIGSMTALENVEFPLVFKRVPSGKRKKLAKEMLKNVGLKGRMHHKPKEMSGGQQQRVGIARAFVAKPAIVFADEPTGNLDSHTTLEVMDLIKDMARKNRQTVVMVTHDNELTKYADKVIRILDGNIESMWINENSYEPEKTNGNGEKVKTEASDRNGEKVKTEASDRNEEKVKTEASDRNEEKVKSEVSERYEDNAKPEASDDSTGIIGPESDESDETGRNDGYQSGARARSIAEESWQKATQKKQLKK